MLYSTHKYIKNVLRGVMSSSVGSLSKKQMFLSILSGTMVAICITLLLILGFATLIRFCNINNNIHSFSNKKKGKF